MTVEPAECSVPSEPQVLLEGVETHSEGDESNPHWALADCAGQAYGRGVPKQADLLLTTIVVQSP